MMSRSALRFMGLDCDKILLIQSYVLWHILFTEAFELCHLPFALRAAKLQPIMKCTYYDNTMTSLNIWRLNILYVCICKSPESIHLKNVLNEYWPE